MEPLNDRDLDELLREWRAPSAPAGIAKQVRKRVRGAWWKWFLTGSIRVPVPLTLAVAAAFVALVVLVTARGREKDVVRPPDQNAAGFQPVKRLEVRIIRSKYEGNQ